MRLLWSQTAGLLQRSTLARFEACIPVVICHRTRLRLHLSPFQYYIFQKIQRSVFSSVPLWKPIFYPHSQRLHQETLVDKQRAGRLKGHQLLAIGEIEWYDAEVGGGTMGQRVNNLSRSIISNGSSAFSRFSASTRCEREHHQPSQRGHHLHVRIVPSPPYLVFYFRSPSQAPRQEK
jgi:hypothetical protein